MILTGDCLEVMPTLPAESVDAIVTDPPYGLEFMGKSWDKLRPDVGGRDDLRANLKAEREAGGSFGKRIGINYGTPKKNPRCRRCYKLQHDHVKSKCKCPNPDWDVRSSEYGYAMQWWHEQWARSAYRVAKPGAYLLAFGGTRTVHRLACAIEDAGWIIRDCLCWVYASGFPKGRANLKPAWEPIVMARKPGPLRPLAIDECRIGVKGAKGIPASVSRTAGVVLSGSLRRETGDEPGFDPTLGRWPANVLLTSPVFDGGWDGVVGGGEQDSSFATNGGPLDGQIFGWGERTADPRGYGDTGTYSRFFMLPASRSDALSGTMGICQTCGAPIAELTSTAGTRQPDTAPPSAATTPSEQSDQLAFDAANPSRSPGTATAPTDAPTSDAGTPDSMATGQTSPSRNASETSTSPSAASSSPEPRPGTTSRSETPARTVAQPAISIDITTTTPSRSMCERCADAAIHGRILRPPKRTTREPLPADGDDYTRFLIIPKAARSDREPVLTPEGHDPSKRFSSHPTVKPTELMRHLVRLVTPVGGTVLDPFLGSGTTGLAAEQEGFDWVGIEREPEYVAIAEARLNGTQRGMAL